VTHVETMTTEAGPASRGAGLRWLRRITPYLGVIPFGVFVTLFLLWPTYIVITGAFEGADGGFDTSAVREVITDESHLTAFQKSIEVSLITALAGSILGALLAWAISIGRRNGPLRRTSLAGAGVFAQFGGVMLAFAFLATFGFNGMVTIYFNDHFGETFLSDASWLYGIGGLCVVYTFFQIPLMLIVFLPAVENIRPQWREASESLGGTTWEYWRHVAGPILFPSFIGSALLLFANAFSAYATAASLISQGSTIVPLQIRGALSSETILGNANLGKALAFGMVVVVGIVMTGYVLLQRRVAKWSQ
jgi:putative spermidine/putrescine transport system permease protein